jgi:hypothetical protein
MQSLLLSHNWAQTSVTETVRGRTTAFMLNRVSNVGLVRVLHLDHRPTLGAPSVRQPSVTRTRYSPNHPNLSMHLLQAQEPELSLPAIASTDGTACPQNTHRSVTSEFPQT